MEELFIIYAIMKGFGIKMLVLKAIMKGIKCFIALPPLGAIIGGVGKFIKWKHWKTALDTAVALSTVVTLLVVFWTMKKFL